MSEVPQAQYVPQYAQQNSNQQAYVAQQPQQGYSQGYPPHGYPQQGYATQQGYPQGYPQQGYPVQPYQTCYAPGSYPNAQAVAIPVQPEPLTQEQYKYFLLMRLSRTVRLLAILDIVFGFFFILGDYPYMACRTVVGFVGYAAAQKMSRPLTLLYIFCMLAWTIAYVVVLSVYGDVIIILAVLMVILELVIVYYVYKFYTILPEDWEEYVARIETPNPNQLAGQQYFYIW